MVVGAFIVRSASHLIVLCLFLLVWTDRFKRRLRDMDLFQLLRVHLEHQCLVCLRRFCPFPSFIFFCVCSLLDLFLIPLLIALVFFVFFL